MDPQQEILKILEEYSLRRKVKVGTLNDPTDKDPVFGDLFFDVTSNTLHYCQGRINGQPRWVKVEDEQSKHILRKLQ
jgi:hypothetical protein